MQNNLLYIRFKENAELSNSTVEQIEATTSEQAETLLGINSLSEPFVNNMKKLLISEMQQAQLQTDLQGLLAEPFIKTTYPDAVYETGIISGKPFIKIWPEGTNGS